MPIHLLTNNGTKFVNGFKKLLWAFLVTKHSRTTGYHQQTDAQLERFNKNIIARLRQYGVEHRQDWCIYVEPMKYAYNAQIH